MAHKKKKKTQYVLDLKLVYANQEALRRKNKD
jgi:hypothetical protein